ncbi:hypothetical protein B0H67DRAFT_495595, partial [Lasiosphaeris hirsuta]
SESVEDQCLRSLFITNPRVDKERIEANTRGGLIENSHRWVLDHPTFKEWRDDPNARVLWIKGGPGTGKTMLLCGIIGELEVKLKESPGKEDRLAYLFCDGSNGNTNSTVAVLRGLAHSLIAYAPGPSSKRLLAYAVKEYKNAGPGLLQGPGAWYTMRSIFLDILRDLSKQPGGGVTYLVIDALNECSTDLDNLLASITDGSGISRVKWLVTSRPRPDIAAALRVGKTREMHGLDLRDHTKELSRTVSAYVDRCARVLVSREDGDLYEQVQKGLRDKTGGATFLYTAHMFARVKNLEGLALLKALQEAALDALGLLTQADYHIRHLQDDARTHCCAVLASVALTYRPLYLSELRALSGIPPKGMVTDDVLQQCSSFFTIDERGATNFISQSAKDFLCGPDTELFPDGLGTEHYRIFSRSLQIMKGSLRRDMCGLERSVSEPPSNADTESWLATARYSCEYWIEHLIDSQHDGPDVRDGGLLMEFLEEKYLFWLETMSWMGKIWLADLAADAHRFLEYNAQGIAARPLQAYASALVFTPTGCRLRHLFSSEEPGWVMVSAETEQKHWSPWVQGLDVGAGSIVKRPAFSFDCAWLAAVLQKDSDRQVGVWSLQTGGRLAVEVPNAGRWVGFASRSSLLGIATSDKKVRFWDVAKSRWYSAVIQLDASDAVFSPDDIWLAAVVYRNGSGGSGSVEIWDWARGDCVLRFGQDADPISSIAYSPNGVSLATGHFGRGLSIWNPESGECLWRMENAPANVVAFSPDARSIVAAGNKVFGAWDQRTGSPLRGVNVAVQVDNHSAVALSPDGSRYAVAPTSEIKIFNTMTRRRLQTLRGYDKYVVSLSFAPNGSLLASGGNGFLRLCRTPLAECDDAREARDYGDEILFVRMAANATRIISVSPKEIQIWDTADGRCLHKVKPKGPDVVDVALSPDGTRFVSFSVDGDPEVWDGDTGTLLHTIDDYICAACFSPDGAKVAVMPSTTNNMKLWNLTAKKYESLDFSHPSQRGPTPACIAFAPTGRHMATSLDNTIRIWDPKKRRQSPLELTSSDTAMALCFSPDGQQLAASYHGKTGIKIWDWAKGSCVQELGPVGGGVPVSVVAFDALGSKLLTNIGSFTLRSSAVTDTTTHSGRSITRELQREGYGVHEDGDFVTWDLERVLWLPQDYRPSSVAVVPAKLGASSQLSVIALGCRSGRMVFLRFPKGGPPSGFAGSRSSE